MYENLKMFIIMHTNKSASQRQERVREERSEGSQRANVQDGACPGLDPGNRNSIEGLALGRVGTTQQSPQVQRAALMRRLRTESSCVPGLGRGKPDPGRSARHAIGSS